MLLTCWPVNSLIMHFFLFSFFFFCDCLPFFVSSLSSINLDFIFLDMLLFSIWLQISNQFSFAPVYWCILPFCINLLLWCKLSLHLDFCYRDTWFLWLHFTNHWWTSLAHCCCRTCFWCCQVYLATLQGMLNGLIVSSSFCLKFNQLTFVIFSLQSNKWLLFCRLKFLDHLQPAFIYPPVI